MIFFQTPDITLTRVQEVVHYLHHINTFWSTLVDGDRQKLSKIDFHTVEILQLMAPAASKADAKKVQGLIVAGEAFQEFSQDERAAIWTKLSKADACQSIIPSLFTFFRDVSYLKACADGIKQLVFPSKGQATVRAAMKRIYIPSQSAERVQFRVQTSETSFRDHECSNSETFELGYRQLWLFAMRHYPQLARNTMSKKAVAKANCGKADGSILYDLAILSQNLGFKSTKAVDLVKVSPDRQIAREALLKARKPESYQYDANLFETLIDRVMQCFTCAIAHEKGLHTVEARVTSLKARCGPPREITHLSDQCRLFLDDIHAETRSKPRNVTSFYVRQCVYFAFFGRRPIGPSNPEHSQETRPSSPLFVPAHSSPMTLDQAGSNRFHDSVRQQRRDERRKKREQKKHFRQRNKELERHRRPIEPKSPIVLACISDTNEDAIMEDPVQVPVESFAPLAEPELDLDMQGANFTEHATGTEISGRKPEDELASQIPQTKSISLLGESDYESSVQDEPETLTIEDCEAPPSESNSFDEYLDQPIRFTGSGRVAKGGELEQIEVSDAQSQIILDEYRVNENGGARNLSSRCSSAVSAVVDEIQATENEIQEALNTLEEDAKNRAQETTRSRTSAVSSAEDLACTNTAEAISFAPVVGQGSEELISTDLQEQIPTSNELIHRGKAARDIREPKRATRLNFRQAKAAMSDQNHQDYLKTSYQQNNSVSEDPLELEKGALKKRRQAIDPHDGMALVSVDDIMEIRPSLSRAPQPKQENVCSNITITFRYREKRSVPGDTTWRVSDQIVVGPDGFAASSEVQRLVESYERNENKRARFYNRHLRKVTAARCVQAAIEDGSYTVFMSLGEDLQLTKEELKNIAEVLEDDSDEEL